jgi:Tol biopolymer transport system component
MLMSAASASRSRELAWFDLNGTRTGTLGEAGDLWQVRMSADDRYAAVTLVAPLLRTLDITVVATGRTFNEPLTLALAADSDPVWAPDGSRIAFRSLQAGRPALFVKRTHDKDAKEESVVTADAVPSDWRGANIIVHTTDGSSGYDVVAIDVAKHTRTTVVKSGFNDTDGRWSPDGAWIAYVSDESGRPDIYANGREGDRIRVSFAGGTRPRWSRDSRSIFFLRGSTIMRATLMDSSPARFAAPLPVLDIPGIRDYDVAHQRDAVLAVVPVGPAPSGPVSVIVDWQSTIRTQ